MIVLFLLRVPMAFAIFGPSVVYFLVEGYTPHLAVRLVMQGIDSWPLLAVPLFILVGIVATRTEIADRLYDAAVLFLGPLRAGLAYVNIAVSLGFSWMSGAALADAAGIGSIEVTHMSKKGYPAEFSVGLSAAPRSSARSCRRASRRSCCLRRRRIHRGPLRGCGHSGAAHDLGAGGFGLFVGEAAGPSSSVTRMTGVQCAEQSWGPPTDGRARDHPGRNPGWVLHSH